MDWPVIGAVAGVAALAGTFCAGAVVVWNSDSELTKPRSSAPVLLVERTQAEIKTEAVYLVRPTTPPTSVYSVPSLQQAPRLASIAPSEPPLDRPGTSPMFRPRTDLEPEPVAPAHTRRELDARPAKPVKPAPEHAAPRVDRRYAHVMTQHKIIEIRSALRLTRDQVPQWRPVEAVLRKIGRDQMAQIEQGGNPEVPSGTAMELYWAAQPLIGSLRDDQKEKVRSLARSLGYPQLASML